MRKKKKIKLKIKNDFTEDVVEHALGNSFMPSFNAEIRHLTVLFSDINSFSEYFVKQSPEEAVSNLNEYFTEMVDVILRYEGTLDQFIGDRMMVEFGVTIPYPDHAERACLAAHKMVRSFDQLRKKWMQEGKEVFDIRIGISTGDMLAGIFGPQQLRNYTVIGDHVNLCSRICDLNKLYLPSARIIISQFTKNELSDKIVTRELDCIRVKGNVEPVAIFELVGENNNLAYLEDFLSHFNEGFVKYKKREFRRALEEFKKALVLYEDNVSKLYINRCEQYINNPPPEDWEGVFTARAR